jgi:hypothetical protein
VTDQLPLLRADPTPATPSLSPDRRRWLARLWPVGSLLTATVSAVWMERDATRASLVGVVALVGWFVVVLAAWIVRRVDHRESDGGLRHRHRAARFLALLVSQTTLQQALAFPLPFFVRATMGPSDRLPTLVHVPFLLAYLGALVVVGWDPAWAAAMRRPALVMAVQAFAAFAALVVALPMLGIDNATSTLVAGVVVGVAVVAGALLTDARTMPRARAGGVVVVAIVVGLLAAQGARFVPPAPLALGAADFSRDVIDREPVGVARTFASPAVLWCHTAIRAPLGLRDRLAHVWRRDGQVVSRIPLDVVGGVRPGGFRTWSKLRRPQPGHWECRVETAIGQVVGTVDAVVTGNAGEETTTETMTKGALGSPNRSGDG